MNFNPRLHARVSEPIVSATPVAWARLERGAGECWQWRVISCPLCGGSHVHRAGRVLSSPHSLLGDCKHPGDLRLYRLVDADQDRTRRLLDAIWESAIAQARTQILEAGR